jgi:hypothetical protein
MSGIDKPQERKMQHADKERAKQSTYPRHPLYGHVAVKNTLNQGPASSNQ